MLPLEGLRILDFTQMMFGPYATQMLGDTGADVIKVEKPGGEWERTLSYRGTYLDDVSPFFLAMNRNKRSICINLKDVEGRKLAQRLAAQCHVVVSNFRPGVMERLGLGYQQLKTVKPDIIVVEGSGWGSDGPYVGRPGQDLLVQSVGGVTWSTGRDEEMPTPAGTSIADAFGAMHLVNAILTAYIHWKNTGEGQLVQVNLLDSLMAIQCQEAVAWMNLGGDLTRPRVTPGAPWIAAPFGIYAVKDGHIALAMNDFAVLARVLEAPQLETHQDTVQAFVDRESAALELGAILHERTLDVLDLLLEADVWCAKVQTLPEALRDPQVLHNDMVIDVVHPKYGPLKLMGHPVHYQGTPADPYRRPVPSAGQDTRNVLHSFGFPPNHVTDLLARGVVVESKEV